MAHSDSTFQATVERMLRDAREMPEGAARRVLALLEESRLEIVGRIAASPEASFSRAQLDGLLREIDRLMREFELKAIASVSRDQERAFELGVRKAEEPLVRAGFNTLIIGPSRTTLALAQAFSADQITDVSRDARREITRAVQRSLIGGVPRQETIDRIGRALVGGETPSFFSKAGQRAARIARNETHRILDMSHDERLRQYAERARQRGDFNRKGALVPGKKWRHTPQERPRFGHVLLNNQTVAADESFTNPRTGIELRFPLDPRAPASETINCKCQAVPALIEVERAA